MQTEQMISDIMARMRRLESENAELATTQVEQPGDTINNTTNLVQVPYYSCIKSSGLLLASGDDWSDDFEGAIEVEYRQVTSGGEITLGPGQQYAVIGITNSGSPVAFDFSIHVVQTGGGTAFAHFYPYGAHNGVGSQYGAGDTDGSDVVPSGDSQWVFAKNDAADSAWLRGTFFDGLTVTWVDPNA